MQPKITIPVPTKSKPTGPYTRRVSTILIRLTEEEHKLILTTSKVLKITNSDFIRGVITSAAREINALIHGTRNSN